MRHTREANAALADAFEHYGRTRRPSEPAANEPGPFDHLSSVELRIELACAEAEKVTTWRGSFIKKDRIAAITRELIERGAF